MPVVTNVFRRGGTFCFRVAVPTDLRCKVGRRELWRSLRTSNPSEARRRGGALLSLTQSLWRDLRSAMTPKELQSLVQAWLRVKFDDDEAERMVLPRKELEDHHRRQMDLYAGAWLNESDDDTTEAKVFLDEFLETLNLRLSDTDYEAAARLMMRGQSQLFRALSARHAYLWQPGNPRPDPAVT